MRPVSCPRRQVAARDRRGSRASGFRPRHGVRPSRRWPWLLQWCRLHGSSRPSGSVCGAATARCAAELVGRGHSSRPQEHRFWLSNHPPANTAAARTTRTTISRRLAVNRAPGPAMVRVRRPRESLSLQGPLEERDSQLLARMDCSSVGANLGASIEPIGQRRQVVVLQGLQMALRDFGLVRHLLQRETTTFTGASEQLTKPHVAIDRAGWSVWGSASAVGPVRRA